MKSFLREVAEHVTAKYGEDLSSLTIVFNNKRPSLFLQQHLSAIIGKPFFAPKVLTIEEFFALGSPYVVADSLTQFFTLWQSYNSILGAEGENEIGAEVFYNTAQIILIDFAQIDRDLVNAADLFAEMKDIAEIESQYDYLSEEQKQFLQQFWQTFSPDKTQRQQEMFLRLWRRMPQLYYRFHQQLNNKGFTTVAKNYRDLAEEKFSMPELGGDVLFIGFNALTKAEQKVFLQLQEEEKAFFYFDTDEYWLNDELQEAGLFMRKNFKAGLINQLSNERDFIGNTNTEINVYAAEGNAAQAKLLGNILPEYYPLLQEKDGASKVAIVLADETLLLPMLQTIPVKYPPDLGYDVRLNITMGYPFSAGSLYALTDIWLNMQQQINSGKKTIYFRDVERFINHPYLEIDTDKISDFWRQVLERQLIEISVKDLEEIATQLFLFFKPSATVSELIAHFRNSMQQVVAHLKASKSLKKLDAEFFVALFSAINKFETNIVSEGIELPVEFAVSLMRKTLGTISVAFSGEPLQGIQVMGLLESRSLDFEHVIIVGANEGLVPKKSSGNTFIPDSIRRAHGLPVLENQNAISAYLFYRLVQRPASLHILYNNTVSNSSTGEPTRFLKQLEFESPFVFKHHHLQQPVTVFNLTERIVEKTPEVMQMLEQFLDNKNQYKRISASAFTTYLSCTMKFFLQYVAGIKEPEEVAEAAEANVIGSVLHEAMDLFYKPFLRKQVTADDIKEKEEEIPGIIKKAFAHVVLNTNSLPQPIDGFRQIVLAIIEQYMEIIVAHDKQTAPFFVHQLENDTDFVYGQIINVNGKKRTVKLFGIIDRIDEVNNELRIVDYKTGGDELLYSSVPELFDPAIKKKNKALLQTLFYTYVYEKMTCKKVIPELYAIRKMRQEGTRFFSKDKLKQVMEGPVLDREKQLFEEGLKATLEELFDTSVPFKNTEDHSVCKYCAFGKICGRW